MNPVTEAGISPILFGEVMVSGLAVGACTPPVGNCLNVCSVVSGMRIGEIFRGASLFLVACYCVGVDDFVSSNGPLAP